MLIEGSFFLYTGITCACFSLFGKVEVTSEKFISLERGSDIVRLHDLNIFAGIPSTPVDLLEPDFEL